MFGIFYLIWSVISDAGYRIKAGIHDANAHVDEHTNTYMGFDGRLRDARTGAYRHWEIDSNGDEVLKDSPTHVVRNISAEERQKGLAAAKENPDGKTVYDTGQRRKITYTEYNGRQTFQHGKIFIDLQTNQEYAASKINVWFKECKGEEKEFYVLKSDPYTIVRITDEQRHYEELNKKHFKYNWISNPEDEKEFVKYYNSLPIQFVDGRCPFIKFSR